MLPLSYLEILFVTGINTLICYGVWVVFQPTNIFEALGEWLDKQLPEYIQKPTYRCPICMSFWYSLLLSLFVWKLTPLDTAITMVAAMGLSVIIVRLFPDKDDEE